MDPASEYRPFRNLDTQSLIDHREGFASVLVGSMPLVWTAQRGQFREPANVAGNDPRLCENVAERERIVRLLVGRMNKRESPGIWLHDQLEAVRRKWPINHRKREDSPLGKRALH
jgi:hypothetical protein